MCDLARDAEVLNFVNYEFRFQPRDGTSSTTSCSTARWGPSSRSSGARSRASGAAASRQFGWVFDASLGGGWVRSYASHAIDFFGWTFGEIVDASGGLRTTIPERPDAEGRMRECTAEDGFTAQMRTESGAWITIDTTATAAVDRPARHGRRQRRCARGAERQRARGRWADTAAHRARDVRGVPDRSVGGAPLHGDAAVGEAGPRRGENGDNVAGHAHLRRRPGLRAR